MLGLRLKAAAQAVVDLYKEVVPLAAGSGAIADRSARAGAAMRNLEETLIVYEKVVRSPNFVQMHAETPGDLAQASEVIPHLVAVPILKPGETVDAFVARTGATAACDLGVAWNGLQLVGITYDNQHTMFLVWREESSKAPS